MTAIIHGYKYSDNIVTRVHLDMNKVIDIACATELAKSGGNIMITQNSEEVC